MEETNEEEGAPSFNEGDRCEISDMKVADLVLVRPAGMDGIDTADDIQYPIDQDGHTKRCDGHQEEPEHAEKDGARGSAKGMDQDLVTVKGEACLLDLEERTNKSRAEARKSTALTSQKKSAKPLATALLEIG